MSTRSRANPWFRPVRPIADALPVPDNAYDEMCRSRVHTLVLSRLSTKWVLRARLLDPKFDERCRELCPELKPLDPVTTNELRKVIERRSS